MASASRSSKAGSSSKRTSGKGKRSTLASKSSRTEAASAWVQDETILEEARRLTSGDRIKEYGHPAVDYRATGLIFTAIVERWLQSEAGFKGFRMPVMPPRVAALMMIGVKVSREAGKPKRDNRVDGAGYFEVVDKCVKHEAANG